MRKAVHRLIDADVIVEEVYTDPLTGASTMAKAERWLPPGMETWTAMGQTIYPSPDWPLPAPWTLPDLRAPDFDPCAAATILDNAGFVQGTTSNPDYDANFPCSAQYMRIDPKTGEDLHFTYKAISAADSPTGWEMALMISDWFKKAGLGHTLEAISWIEMVITLINLDLEDYQFMTGVGIVWGTTTPEILRDFTYSEDVPLWNFVYMNFSEADYWGTEMMATLNRTRVLEAAVRIQEVLDTYEPYRPILLWLNYAALGPGTHRVVNMVGQGIGQGWSRQRTWSGRHLDDKKVNEWIYSAEICSQNPLEANCAVDWGTILGNVYEGLWTFTPYLRNYWPWGAEYIPTYPDTMKEWIGPGGSERVGGDGVYNKPYADPDGVPCTGDETYGGKLVSEVTAADLAGDDVLGMCSIWKLRDDIYWHDSDPGPDLKFGTADDGVVYPVTSEDVRFMAGIMMNKTERVAGISSNYENIRYAWFWPYLAGYGRYDDPSLDPEGPFAVEIIDDKTFVICEERRYMFSFQDHDILMLGAKHIWEPYLLGPDGIDQPGETGDDGDPMTWTGYEQAYMPDPVLDRICYPENNIYGAVPETFEGLCAQHTDGTPFMLTYQIGFGPFVYHEGGWTPAVSTHIEVNPLYFAGTILPSPITDPQYDRGFPNPADVDLEVFYNPALPEGLQYYGLVDGSDVACAIRGLGSYAGKLISPRDPCALSADLIPPYQEITGAEILWILGHKGQAWGPGYPA
jgi:hypothetical protein